MSRERRRGLVERSHRRLPVARQCKLLGISRSSVYYRRKPTPQTDLELMAALDRQYLETPYFGSRRMQALGSRPKGTASTASGCGGSCG